MENFMDSINNLNLVGQQNFVPTNETQENPLNALPWELVEHIISFVPKESLPSAALVSKQFKNFTFDQIKNTVLDKTINAIDFFINNLDKQKHIEVIKELQSLINENPVSNSSNLIELTKNTYKAKKQLVSILSKVDTEILNLLDSEFSRINKPEAFNNLVELAIKTKDSLNNEEGPLKQIVRDIYNKHSYIHRKYDGIPFIEATNILEEIELALTILYKINEDLSSPSSVVNGLDAIIHKLFSEKHNTLIGSKMDFDILPQNYEDFKWGDYFLWK